MMRFNSHWHGIILEVGFDTDGRFIFIPIHALDKMAECFRRRVIRFFLDRKLITEAIVLTVVHRSTKYQLWQTDFYNAFEWLKVNDIN